MKKDYIDIGAFHMSILEKMVQYSFPGKDEIHKQIKSAKARPINGLNDYSIEFSVKSPELAVVDNRLPIELEALDNDGVPIGVLLFVDNGVISFMEFYKADSSKIVEMPLPDSFIRKQWQ